MIHYLKIESKNKNPKINLKIHTKISLYVCKLSYLFHFNIIGNDLKNSTY